MDMADVTPSNPFLEIVSDQGNGKWVAWRNRRAPEAPRGL